MVEEEEKEILGIDLGTTTTCVYSVRYKNGKPAFFLVENRFGSRLTPSYVTIIDDDIIVGDLSKKNRFTNTKNTFYAIKRLIGRKERDESVQSLYKNATFEIEFEKEVPHLNLPLEDGSVKTYTLEEIQAMILSSVKKDAEKKGIKTNDCVITVPAHFNDLQRDSVRDSARLAGLNCIQLLNEPTAAAIAYKEQMGINDGKILVYDFGGGTLDVTIIDVKGNDIDVLATTGNSHLGGEDIDSILVKEMIKRFKDKFHVDISNNERANNLLRTACEETKIIISNVKRYETNVPSLYKNNDFVVKLSTYTLEDLCEDLFSVITDPIDDALDYAKLKREEIDEIILVGGSTNIPYVRDTIKDYFKKEPKYALNVQEVVALGAAIYCQKLVTGKIVLNQKDHSRKPGVWNVTDFQTIPIGVKLGRTNFSEIIKKGSLPQKGHDTFSIENLFKKFASIQVYQGEGDVITPDTHIKIGECKFRGLPGDGSNIELRIDMEINNDGILTCFAECLQNGTKQTIEIKKNKFTDDEVAELRYKIDQAQEFAALKERYESRHNDLVGLIYELKHKGIDAEEWENIKDELEKPPSKRDDLERALGKLEKCINNIKKLLK